MNITFLIGNGFDRNLGLKTTYSDFVKVYKKSEAKTDTLRYFHKYISENEELWSAAEEEMGRYTAEFAAGDGAAFYQCHKDFCEKLANYLKEESRKMNYQAMARDIASAFSMMNSLTSSFPTQEREVLDAVYAARKSENITFNFIVYNYTDTLDRCVTTIKRKQEVLGTHQYQSRTHNHTIGDICHVHGTVETQMVFGVNDKTQIAKPEIFECEYGDLYEDLLIKKQANQGYQENTDDKAKRILDNSQIIYIFGMSIGVTDALWWERVCAWLNGSASRHLIVFRYSMPPRGLLEVDYKIEERKAKQEITNFAQLPDNQKREIEKRIHISGANIFADVKDITVNQDMPNEEIRNQYGIDLANIQRIAETTAPVIQALEENESYKAMLDYIDKHNGELPEITVV